MKNKKNNKNNKKVGIIGVGFVGKSFSLATIRGYLKGVVTSPVLYDKYRGIGSIEEINKADIIFLCVPTPYDKKIGFDVSAVEDAFSILKGNKTIIIKSTVIPGTTERLQKKYPNHKIIFSPEFLRAETAEKDVLNPFEQVVGYTKKSKGIAKKILQILPKAPYEFIVPATEAEVFKYFSNTFLATKVIFANQFYDLCQKLNIDYERVKGMARVSPRFGFSHFEIFMDGFRGYKGACLPKDTKALIQLGDKIKVSMDLLKQVDKINEKLLKLKKT